MTAPYPLHIGFAGQRPLALARGGSTSNALAIALLAVLDGLASSLGTTTLITGLAMGADQLAIRAVSHLKRAGQDWRIHGLLPCHPALFIAHALPDYAVEHGLPTAPKAQADLVVHWQDLLGRLDHLTILPTHLHPGTPPVLPQRALPLLTAAFGPCDPLPPGMTIDYARASQAILEQSDMLLAVWDGSASRGAGGTADMIAKARAKGTPVMILDPRTGQTDVTARAIQQHLAHNERGEERDRQGPP